MSKVVLNEVRRGAYLDSVALMRISQVVRCLEQIEEATLMMGTPANKEIMADAGILSEVGRAAGGSDLVIAVRAQNAPAAKAGLAAALAQLDAPALPHARGVGWRPRTLQSAAAALRGANVALISVPGEYAAAEARKAIRAGLHTMIFSDNVPIEAEAELKLEARDLGVLVMGPDCGTAIISGTPLAFANRVSRGTVGIVGASGTGIQEVACLIDRMGGGISHAIGTGGRDLNSAVGGITAQLAVDALARDHGTERIVLIAKPQGDDVARLVLDRLQSSAKPAVACFLGASRLDLPDNVRQAFTLKEAAFAAMGASPECAKPGAPRAKPGGILGLFAGGTLCAEAQVIFRDEGFPVASNAPVAGVPKSRSGPCLMLDLGSDEYTLGRPHPMIDPDMRNGLLKEALERDDLGVILLDLVIGHGAHPNPAAEIAAAVRAHRRENGPVVICSVTGTERDPQVLSRQENECRSVDIAVAPSNADAARWALAAARGG